MRHLCLLAAALIAVPAWAQDADLDDHPCVKNIRRHVAFRDPDSIRVVSISPPKAEVIDYANTRLMAFRFTVMVNSKNEAGRYTGQRPYECYTSEDRRRVLDFKPKND